MKPCGRGAWVAFQSAANPDNVREHDLQTIVERAKRLGANWLAVRAGAGTGMDADLRDDSLAYYRANGFQIFAWIFDYKDNSVGEIAAYKRWVGKVDGVIMNAEFEYLGEDEAEARALVAGIRACGFDFVGHAPPDYAGGRGDGALKILDEVCDAIFPQVYAYEHDDSGHVHHLNNIRALYAARNLLHKVSPVGCTYRPNVRGGRNLAPIADYVVAQDVVAFLAHPWTQSCESPSLYSIDAITFAGQGREAVLAAVEAYDKEHPKEPFNPVPPLLRQNPQDAVGVLPKEEQISIEEVLEMTSKPSER